jgi:hypothetical protein
MYFCLDCWCVWASKMRNLDAYHLLISAFILVSISRPLVLQASTTVSKASANPMSGVHSLLQLRVMVSMKERHSVEVIQLDFVHSPFLPCPYTSFRIFLTPHKPRNMTEPIEEIEPDLSHIHW